MPDILDDQFQTELSVLEAKGRIRVCALVSGSSRTVVILDGEQLVSFCSNDYLGLSNHPSLANAAISSIRQSGFGASASRLVSGNFPEHRALEDALSKFLDLEGVVLFPTGYQANLGVLTSLAGPGDVIFCDHFNHASIIDACRLSRSRPAFYKHLDLAHLEKKLLTVAASARRKFIVTESLFGMDGQLAPLADLASLAAKYNAALIVDEAHALGVLGPCGRGLCHELGVRPYALIGTLGKAFGASGGFVAGSSALCRYLVNRSRPFIFTTALPPSVAAAALAALQIILSPEGHSLRDNLALMANQFSASYSHHSSPHSYSPIYSIVLGQDQAATKASQSLRASGFFVQAIRPPTVPEGTARLRITFSATHLSEDVLSLARALGSCIKQ